MKTYQSKYTGTEIDQAIGQVSVNTNEINLLESFLGFPYQGEGIYGTIADFENRTFERWGQTETTLTQCQALQGRKRCNLSDAGVVNAYYGDAGYIEDGSNGQVMVEQPKFYYRVVPLKLDKQTDGIGYHLRKALYLISDNYFEGSKVHPRFLLPNGSEIDKVYLSAYEACIYDTSAGSYITDDAQIADFATDKLSSIVNVKPCSGLTQNLTRSNIQLMANNRGNGWMSDDIKTESMNQLLMIIELNMFNTQVGIGRGVVDFPSGTGNESVNTGQTSSLGNQTGQATGIGGQVSVTYRGMENPWGNILKFVYGLNIYGDGTQKGGIPYYCTDFDYKESVHDGNYKSAEFTISNASGYISAFGYSEYCDWMFIPSECLGNSNLPVGDYTYVITDLNGYRLSLLGGSWSHGSAAGGFSWSLSDGVGGRARVFGGRSLYVPQN
ncbi:MAG: hypothetical protein PHE29_13535 [Tissierellia bacterium]|nr:hypothetical protein [Tissierellia bacterium]